MYCIYPKLRLPLALVGILLAAVLVCSCESIPYYAQAVSGQLDIRLRQKSIQKVLADPKTPEPLQRQLRQVLDIRRFAREHLSLPVDDHYSSYVHIDRDHVVWVVFAAPEFSFDPKQWCYPVVGCTAYRSYFAQEAAEKLAAKLARLGFDTYVSGVSAYSTLGWFQDPVLSTVIDRAPADLAALIFHELAHQVLYLPDDTTFNESFAVAVEQAGLKLWLHHQNQPDRFEIYRLRRKRQAQFRALILKYRQALAELYTQPVTTELKRRRKAALITEMRAAYQKLKTEWLGYSGYDYFFNLPLNNAQLNSVATYQELVPGFLHLLHQNDNDFKRFFEACIALGEHPKNDRRQQLTRTKGND